MASTINADTSNGVVITPDTSGELELQSNGTTVLKVDSPTGSLTIPVGTTAERPVSPTVGMMRYNTTEAYYEQYDGSAWVEAGGSAYDAPTTSTGYFALPTGTTAQRPASPATGYTRYNTDTGFIEIYNTIGGWKDTTESGNAFSYTLNYIVVAGGAGGGGHGGGGGGAGGFRELTKVINYDPASPSTYNITIGAGGAGGITNVRGVNGSTTTFTGPGISITNVGGGGGGSRDNAPTGASGGSGGGSHGPSQTGGSGTSGQGNNGGGGNGVNSVDSKGGGGGGANAAGQKAPSSTVAGAGGSGKSSSITGTSIFYAGGGGGGTLSRGTPGAGGAGGGGAGTSTITPATAGTANTGGGGGGGKSQGYGGQGGSGVVIMRMPTTAYTGTTTGSPTVTTSGSNTIIKFTSSGSYTG